MLEAELSDEVRGLVLRATEEANRCSSSVIDQVRPRVARWEYASGPVYTMDPLRNEISGIDPGRRLKRPPARAKKLYVFGFDSESRLIWDESRWQNGTSYLSIQFAPDLRANLLQEPAGASRVLGVTVIERSAVRVRTAFRQGPLQTPRRWAARQETLDARGRPVHLWIASPDGLEEYGADYDDAGLVRLRALPHEVVIWERPLGGDGATVDYEERLTQALSRRIERAVSELDANVVLLVHGSEGVLPPQLAVTNLETMRSVPADARFDPHSMPGDIGDWPQGLDALSLDDAELGGDALRIKRPHGVRILAAVAKNLSAMTWGSEDRPRKVHVLAIDLDRGQYAKQFRQQLDPAVWAQLSS
jgi:hypothetical protein